MSQQNLIYLDNNATTKIEERVLKAMLSYLTEVYANPSSSHLAGLTVREAIETAAFQTACLIGGKPHEITFTSGATESINLVIKGLGNAAKKHIVTVATEHKAVLDTCAYMETLGYAVTYLPVDSNGQIDLKTLDDVITDKTLIVIVMHTNNETGVIHDIMSISEIVHRKNSLLFCDATQAVGKLFLDVKKTGIDYLAFSAHKFHGPKGIGALYVSSNIKPKLIPQIHGGGQQRKLRSGTLNVAGIIGLGKACEIAFSEMETHREKITTLRDTLEKGLLQIQGTFVNGSTQNRIYNTTNICFPGINSERMILALKNIAVSSGSSCSAVTSEPSHVLTAMGISDENALCSLRFSFSKYNTAGEVNETISKIKSLIPKLI
jgi:cysteine desulfurase